MSNEDSRQSGAQKPEAGSGAHPLPAAIEDSGYSDVRVNEQLKTLLKAMTGHDCGTGYCRQAGYAVSAMKEILRAEFERGQRAHDPTVLNLKSLLNHAWARAEKAEEQNAWYEKRCTWYQSELDKAADLASPLPKEQEQ
jgi:hypothetical protein